jgi:DNA polymerase elongation subunit (family B)
MSEPGGSDRPSVVAGWHDDTKVYLVLRDQGRAVARQYAARWSMFLEKGPGRKARVDGDKRVERVVEETRFLRVDCISRRDRWSLADELARAYGRAAVREADVRPLERYLADHPELAVAERINWVMIDIETDPSAGILAAKQGKSRILSWAAEGHDGLWDCHVLDQDSDDAERGLLRSFLKRLGRYDLIIAYYGGGDRESDSGFDFDAIRNRCKTLGIEVPSWHRWAWLDYLEVLEQYYQGDGEEKASMALDHIMRSLLDPDAMAAHAARCAVCAFVWQHDGGKPQARKLDVDAGQIMEIWRQPEERVRIGRYNLWDVHGMRMLEDQHGFLVQHLEVCRLCRVIPHTRSTGAVAQADGIFLGSSGDERWPTKWPDDKPNEAEKYLGAIVQEPTMTGLIPGKVAVWDFAGMYPTITTGLNAGPDSKVAPETREPQVVSPVTGTRFSAVRESAFIGTTRRLIGMRKRYQDLAKAETPGTTAHRLLSAKSQAAKIVTNSISYGVIGSRWSRFYDREVAEAISTTGRWMKERVIAWASDWNIQVFYGDTDSDFVLLVGTTWERVQEFVDWVNTQWQGLYESLGTRWPVSVRLEAEKMFSRLLLCGKKAYAGALAIYKGKVAAPGTREIKGLEIVRGDSLRPARAMQGEVIDRLLGDGVTLPDPPGEVEVQGFLASWRERLMKGKIARTDLVFRQGMGKTVEHYHHSKFSSAHCKKCRHDFGDTAGNGLDACPTCGVVRTRNTPAPHARVAIELQAAGEMIQVGDKIEWVAVLDPDSDGSTVSPARVSPESLARLDLGYYWERVAGPAVRLLSGLGHPTNYVAQIATESRQIRRDAVKRIRSSSDAGLPLLAGLQQAAPAVRIVISTPEDVDYLHALAVLCRGRHPLIIEIESRDEPAAVLHCDPAIYGVDPKSLAQMDRVKLVDSLSYRIMPVVQSEARAAS